MYRLIRPLLFLLDPERVHALVFGLMRLPGVRASFRSIYRFDDPRLERTVFGLKFKNPVGLAAGFDKDGKLIDSAAALGFGFIEIGTLTPKPQPGNQRPRLFRLPKDQALINRMGFNNEGVLAAVERLKKRKHPIILGGNIGKNKATAIEDADSDYVYCFNALFDHVDYFVVNVSSPNTPGLRGLQEKEPLQRLLRKVKDLSFTKPVAKPILLKIAPDLTTGQLDDIVEILKSTGVDGVIATNTTISREQLLTDPDKVREAGAGGLSGRPLSKRSTDVIRYLRAHLGPGYPIIGVGGIMTPDDAMEKLDAGADLIQLYTGFIYEGPGLIKRINQRILQRAVKAGQNRG